MDDSVLPSLIGRRAKPKKLWRGADKTQGHDSSVANRQKFWARFNKPPTEAASAADTPTDVDDAAISHAQARRHDAGV